MTIKKKDQSEEKYEQKWEEYVEKFLSNDSLELKALKVGNLLQAHYRNILEHLLKARLLAEVLSDLLGVKGEAKDKIITAATIHDCFVLEEKAFISEKRESIEGASYLDLQFIKEKSADKLRELGFSEDIIALTDENITHEDDGPKELSSEIFFLVDAMLSGPEIVDIPKRFELTRKGWHSGKKAFDEETRKRTKTYWNDFFKGAPGHGNKPHDVVQLKTADRICRKFTAILKLNQKDTNDPKYEYVFGEKGNPNMLPYYIEDKLKQKITAS